MGIFIWLKSRKNRVLKTRRLFRYVLVDKRKYIACSQLAAKIVNTLNNGVCKDCKDYHCYGCCKSITPAKSIAVDAKHLNLLINQLIKADG